MRLEGKVALVTGAGRGIGEGVARHLAAAGACVLVADIDSNAAAAVSASLNKDGRTALAATADVTSAKQIEAMVQKAIQEFGRLDIAVNNAGIVGANSLQDISEAEWDRLFEVNVKSVFLCCRAQAQLMEKNGGGAIINMASVAGKMGVPGMCHYAASKFAVIGFTQSIAKEYARRRVRINAICPGIVGTKMWKGSEGLATLWKGENETVEEAWNRHVDTLLPQGEPQTPEDIAEAVIYLALAPHVIGQALNVDGGACAH